jgi:hypothetical protein
MLLGCTVGCGCGMVHKLYIFWLIWCQAAALTYPISLACCQAALMCLTPQWMQWQAGLQPPAWSGGSSSSSKAVQINSSSSNNRISTSRSLSRKLDSSLRAHWSRTGSAVKGEGRQRWRQAPLRQASLLMKPLVMARGRMRMWRWWWDPGGAVPCAAIGLGRSCTCTPLLPRA